MSKLVNAACVAAAIAASAIAPNVLAADSGGSADKAGKQSKSDDKKAIASAMQAAPKKVSSGATIVTMKPDGTMQTLREGTNGFTCMPDNPATPGPDPMCMDKAAMEWAMAWIGHKQPPDAVGFMYMLAGGTDASNTDPYATEPGADKHWIKTGPHVMIVGAKPSFYDMYPKNPDPDTEMPYVMWPDTPYRHLMIPTK